jgi:four helix bundle protein
MPDNLLLDDLDIYQQTLEIGECVWNIVLKWEYFSKRTVGGQFVEAADSIASNIAEGYGRYFYKDRKQFYYYSRGSLLETKNMSNEILYEEIDFPGRTRYTNRKAENVTSQAQ